MKNDAIDKLISFKLKEVALEDFKSFEDEKNLQLDERLIEWIESGEL